MSDVDSAPREGRLAASQAQAIADLRSALRGLGEVRAPGDAEAPILAPGVRAWLLGWLAELRAADELAAVGLKPRTTTVLHGPPGCGKTTLAHHLAARLGIPMVVVGPETILASYVGESEGNMGKLFDCLARHGKPTLLFMDELEALGRKRDGGRSDGGVRSNVLTVLLRKVEAFQGYLIGATNRAEMLDPALWRRFAMQLAIDLPGDDERFAVIARYLDPFALPDAELELLTSLTQGASPALLRGVVEGIKRALVLGPRVNKPADDPVAVLSAITVAVAPPPESEPPLLWTQEGRLLLRGMAWPPVRKAA